MPTKITIGLEGSTRDGLTAYFVQEDFDTVVDRFWPLSQPSSTLQGRENNIFTTLDGKRILIKTPAILSIEEDANDDD